MQSFLNELPDLYNGLLPSVFEKEIPKEELATCNNCVMTKKDAYAHIPGAFFNPNTKCCTYHPAIPNYLLGALFANKDEMFDEGRQRIRKKIEVGVAVRPEGIMIPSLYHLHYRHINGRAFGNSTTLLCPYYQEGSCTIWKFRDSVCSTYFCKSVRGKFGTEFYKEVKNFLTNVQARLSQYCLTELGLPNAIVNNNQFDSPEYPIKLSADDLDGRKNEKNYAELWGNWDGKEEDLYIACYEMVSKLTSDQLIEIMGYTAKVNIAHLETLQEAMVNPIIPKTLSRNRTLEVIPLTENSVAVLEDKNTIELSNRLHEALNYFDGKHPTENVLQSLLDKENVALASELITALYLSNILIDADRIV